MTRPPRHVVVVDTLAVLVLVGLAELGLANTFEGWSYLVVAGVAAVLGLLVAVLTAGIPGAVLVAAVPLVALVFGGPVALRSKGLGLGVPGAQTLADVLQGTLRGWGELLSTLPWVDLSGSPAMVPFLLAYLGAVLAAALAVRTRSAGAPLVPLLAMLTIVLLIRRPEGTGSDLLDWYPVAFAAVAVGWLVIRSLRVAPGASVSGARRGRISSRTTLATLVVGTVVLVAVPMTIPFSASGTPPPRGPPCVRTGCAWWTSPRWTRRCAACGPSPTRARASWRTSTTRCCSPCAARPRAVACDW